MSAVASAPALTIASYVKTKPTGASQEIFVQKLTEASVQMEDWLWTTLDEKPPKEVLIAIQGFKTIRSCPKQAYCYSACRINEGFDPSLSPRREIETTQAFFVETITKLAGAFFADARSFTAQLTIRVTSSSDERKQAFWDIQHGRKMDLSPFADKRDEFRANNWHAVEPESEKAAQALTPVARPLPKKTVTIATEFEDAMIHSAETF